VDQRVHEVLFYPSYSSFS